MRHSFSFLLLILSSIHIFGQQNVAINNDGSDPHPLAILDVKSTSKGVLLPRMSSAERMAIQNPPEGLMIYDTDHQSIYFYTADGGANSWNNVMSSDLVLPYFEGVSLNNAAFHIQNAEPSPTAIAGQFSAGDGIGVNGEGNIGGKFFGATTGIDVVGGGNGGYAGKFYSGNQGVYIDLNGNDGKALIVDNGKTGLGTITPTAKLHVRDANASNGNTTGEAIFKASAYQPSIPDEMNLEYWIAQPAGGEPNEPYFGMRSNHRLNLVSNNNTSNPEISLLDNKVGINKKDGTYPLSINGKTAIYEDNVYMGEIYGDGTTGNLHINAKTVFGASQEMPTDLILQTAGYGSKSGKVGVNTSSPMAFLDVQKSSNNNGTAAILGTSIFSEGSNNVTRIEGGTVAELGVLSLNYSSKANVNIANGGGDVHIAPTEDMSGDVFIASGFFNVPEEELGTNGGNVFIAQSGGDVLMKHPNTTLSIGTDNKDHKLNVNGTIRSTELIVESGWADYVFAKDYFLKPIEDVEKYIIAHNHLPNIPPASEIQENGLKVSEISTKMMEKIEEMMLYIIEQNKQIKDLQKEVSLLKIK
jgi:hypothetical protein